MILKNCNNDKLLKLINNKNNWYEIFINYFYNYCFDDIVNSLLKHLKDNKEEMKKIKSVSISEIYNNLSFDTYIRIFKALDTKIKMNIINSMFNLNEINWGGDSNKIPFFIDIMIVFKQIRNKCCHKKPIYNFVCNACYQNNISMFLFNNLNAKDKKLVLSSELNLFAVVCCIDIFRTFADPEWNTIKTRVKKSIINYKKFTVEIIPDETKLKLKNLGLKLFRDK